MQIRRLQERYKRGGRRYFHSLYNLISSTKDLKHNINTKMQHLVVFCLVIVAVLAAPPQDDVTLLRSDSSIDQAGYQFAFEQSDGQKRDETGEVTNVGQENESIAVRGSFAFTGKLDIELKTFVIFVNLFLIIRNSP